MSLITINPLAGNEGYFHSVFEYASIGIAVTDLEGMILETNPVLLKFLGYTDEEILGKSVLEVVLEEHAEQTRQLMKKTVAGEIPGFTLEKQYIRKDGSIFWGKSTVTLAPSPDGKPCHFIGLMQDITQQKATEEALKKSEARFRRIADSGMIGIMFANRNGEFTDANDALLNMIGYSQADLQQGQLNWKTLTPPEYESVDAVALAEMVEHGASKPYEKQFFHKNGHRIDLLLGATFVDDAHNESLAYILDITKRKKAERKALEGEERFRIMAEASTFMIVITDQNGHLTYINQACHNFFGYAFDEWTGINWQDLIHPDDFEEHQRNFIAGSESRQKFNLEFRMRKADGEYRWIYTDIAPIMNTEGEFLGLIGANIDITLRKNALLALQESENRFRRMADSAPLFIWMSDSEGHTHYVNQTWADFLGMSAEDVIAFGMKASMIPEEQQAVRAYYRNALAKREPYTIECRMRRHDGELRWVHNKGAPLLLPNGELSGYIGISVDITDRKIAEERLQSNLKREQLIRHLIEVITESFDIDTLLQTVAEELGKYLDADRSSVLRYTFHNGHHGQNGELSFNLSSQYWKEGNRPPDPEDMELLTKAFSRLNPEIFANEQEMIANIPDEELYLAYLRQEMNAKFPEGLPGLTTEQLIEIVRKYEVKSSVRVTIFYRGTPCGNLSVSQCSHNREWTQDEVDLLKTIADHVGSAIYQAELYQSAQQTASKELQARKDLEVYAKKLEISNMELEQFATIASHDLKEPLRKIQVFGEMLQEMMPDDTSKEYLGRMQAAASRMQSLIEDLLLLSRVNRKGKPFQIVDMNLVVATVLDDLAVFIQETGATVETQPLHSVFGDSYQICQVMQNLVSNGLKYRKEGVAPHIKIYGELLPTGDYKVTIQDNGIGIDQNYFERIFEPFQRLHGVGKYPGTGMGLTICKKIIDRHEGSITVESILEEGSRFSFTLPTQMPAETSSAAS